jgi:DNA segregation ATPase FtsK/SpoIIIE, S-DNA-T family
MASNSFKTNRPKKKGERASAFKFNLGIFRDKRFQLAFGFFIVAASLFMLVSFTSYLFTGHFDQSVLSALGAENPRDLGLEARNWLGLFGAWVSHLFIYKWFGIASFLFVPILFFGGYKILFSHELLPLSRFYWFSSFSLVWLSLLFGYLVLFLGENTNWFFLGGGFGFEMALWMDGLMGWGTILLLALTLSVFSIFFFNITHFNILPKEGDLEGTGEDFDTDISEAKGMNPFGEDDQGEEIPEKEDTEVDIEEIPGSESPEMEVEDTQLDEGGGIQANEDVNLEIEPEPDPDLQIEEGREEEKIGGELEHYDPTLDLPNYKFPSVRILKDYDHGKAKVSKEELEANKNKIVETLIHFSIEVSSIKATIGPTVTLYEIIPKAGVKISKIKNLEDDIALSLAALGIRIIAPIPGKGTIGIEVPNKNRELVSMKSVITTEKFQSSEMELPVILGKTISNELYISDLTKMPHILVAGATGQGKSVGINVLLTSLLYKKHPSQLKFILVDPKKVELSLFNKIEKHFLAELPDAEEPIITETKKVIYTLNSLCIEMDARYDLMKSAGCRNIKEYNQKFVNRRLNPEKGHRFLPYLVLVIDELADLMMTAGKEVETPIARLAQLARAIGIHLVVATQRPSVNVITGVIKANFPARLSYKVTSKVDSRTILDVGGADRLVGMGDMLFAAGSETVRLQSPFIDTDEIEDLCGFIGSQKGYESAYLLPEFVGDEGENRGEFSIDDRDALFEEAARLVVIHQQGSTSLIQRKLSLGYNRAGRIIDQLEAAGVVGPFEGSKARQVLFQDEISLEQFLKELGI